ncbi:MAG: acyl-CoA/acyl-ACP dehydrogenase [Frankiales bacterium]|nr:acyl-CoA/acyl-ACP dehydrogenase [Frankiales bacterium]
MNTSLDETQVAVRDVAADVFGRRTDPARVEKVEATADRFDRELWTAIAETGLLGVVVPEESGGLGLGAVELVLVLEQWGRSVAPVPFPATLLASWLLASQGDDAQRSRWLPEVLSGSAVVAVASPASTVDVRVADGRLDGTAVGVAWAHVAGALLLPVGEEVYLVDLSDDSIGRSSGETTAREVATTLDFRSTPATRVGTATAGWLRDRSRVAWAAAQAGIASAALELTASYTSQREQFGKPLSTFQGVALKAADAYLDATAIRGAAWQAAAALDSTDTDVILPTLTAAWWAAEAGQHAVHLTQHLHGGMGADVTYPVHRYFLWGKQIELLLGGASALLAELGDALAARPDAGDALVL